MTANPPRPLREGILLVEDDCITRQAMTLFLELVGYPVVSAADGREALEFLRAGAAPRLILLDLIMPGMDGRTFRTEQRSDPSLAAIPVLIISGDSAIADTAAGLGAVGYLQKPVQMDELIARVHFHYRQ